MEITEKIIDGKSVSKQIIEEVKQNTIKAGVKPGLALILVGNDPASEVYVRNKGRVCEEIGFYSVTEKLPETTPESELLEKVHKYNEDKNIHGLLVQLPLPKHIDELKVIEAVNYKKDVDGFHPVNAGRLLKLQAKMLW